MGENVPEKSDTDIILSPGEADIFLRILADKKNRWGGSSRFATTRIRV